MKKRILIFSVAICTLSAAQAQDIFQYQAPSVIVNEFSKQYPKATDVEWEIEGDFYKVDFETGWNVDHEIWYNAEGKMVKHKEDISKIELPKTVTDRIKTDFNGYTIDDLKRITDNGKIVYKMELNALMKRDWNVVIDTNGNVLSKMAD
ncbi:MAG: PepSY-like domain-containing protein [Sphingobacteriales bacterium]|jgi:uncharacterized membrane protein YkoI|nr:PepSY-like domain-containing protein [Sphingobacteriales bacterium]MBP9140811.1 PepSY-like domain-containing protein [Chitinophagales bacterium]MDA0198351.1 PepSY-like domain-containing protein [Bacteroidota bacterium]MBK6891207.1 PepSY-like domain-containing protein [Sphingobacteriales bacterium]MBK7526968.1 PepSY-like domain-containing protein [Sphingobacteriales bacterium]